MQFKHPELLYALLLLIIPVLVHLFQLRKFRKEKFTNVKFLKKASLQTRKSSKLKKWLILCTRLLLLAALVLAFARPFLPTGEVETASSGETVIYLDNSYSMQARGSEGVLLRRSVQELLEHLPEDQFFSFFTNDSEYRAISTEALKQELQRVSYAPSSPKWQNVDLKARNLFSAERGIAKEFIAISDFQTAENKAFFPDTTNYRTRFVQLKPESGKNLSIDTAFIETRSLEEIVLQVRFRGTGNVSPEVSVSLYNDEDLLARKTVELDEQLNATTSFDLPAGETIKGRISIDDTGLSFDDDLYFSINPSKPIEVVVINESDDSFLRRIYREPEFNLRTFPSGSVDFNVLSGANLIVLNELETISSPLSSTIQNLLNQGTYLLLIPATEGEISGYNDFFRETGIPLFQSRVEEESLVTEISYSHPLYAGVFDEQITNFQYPRVALSFRSTSNSAPVLTYDDGEAFLFQSGNSFVFTAPINEKNSNFQASPLIVPSLYNIGNFALRPSQLYYILGETVKADVHISLGKDEILQVSTGENNFIPRQQSFQNKVELTFEESPKGAGHYEVMKDSLALQTISFNIDRAESRMEYADIDPQENRQVYSAITEVFEDIGSENNTQELWKWFVIFALILLFTEMLILKYFK